MSDEKWKGFQSTISEHKKQDEALEETIKIKRGNIQKEADNLRLLEGYCRKRLYVRSMYENVPEDKINEMNVDKYSYCMSTLGSGVVSGGAAFCIRDESEKAGELYGQHSGTLASLDVLAGSDSTSVNVLSVSDPDLFPNGVKITQDYEVEDEIDKNIGFIEQELGVSFPDVKDDFDYFVTKFYAFQSNKSQYQDLIGSRSMFFWNLIFGFSKQHFGFDKPRRKTIQIFVFGSAMPISSAQPLLDACYNVYGEMSGQDPSSGMSVKTGDVDPPYIEGLFRRLVGSIAVILSLRKQYFRP